MQIKFTLQKADFSLHLEQAIPVSGVSVIFGASGCGKTTLLRCVAGLEKEVQGECQVADGYWQKGNVFVPAHKREIGYVLQDPSLFPHLSVLGNIQFAMKRSKQASEEMFSKVIDVLDIAHLLERNVLHLSGGEKQRVGIARAICCAPKVLLMDEPLAALDRSRKNEVLSLIKMIPATFGIPVLYVTHSLEELVYLADHILLLSAGRVIDSGSLQEMLLRHSALLCIDQAPISVLEADVLEISEQWGLAKVGNKSMNLWVKNEDFCLDDAKRFRISASDIALSREQSCNSAQNILLGIVDSIEPDKHPSSVIVNTRIQQQIIRASITRKALSGLSLQVGDNVYLEVKATAVMV